MSWCATMIKSMVSWVRTINLMDPAVGINQIGWPKPIQWSTPNQGPNFYDHVHTQDSVSVLMLQDTLLHISAHTFLQVYLSTITQKKKFLVTNVMRKSKAWCCFHNYTRHDEKHVTLGRTFEVAFHLFSFLMKKSKNPQINLIPLEEEHCKLTPVLPSPNVLDLTSIIHLPQPANVLCQASSWI